MADAMEAKKAVLQAIALAGQEKYDGWVNTIYAIITIGALAFPVLLVYVGYHILVEGASPLSWWELPMCAVLFGFAYLAVTGLDEIPAGKQYILTLFGKPVRKKEPGFVYRPWPIGIEEVDNTLKPMNVENTLIETTLDEYPPEDATADIIDEDEEEVEEEEEEEEENEDGEKTPGDAPKTPMQRVSLIRLMFKEVSINLRYDISDVEVLNDYFIHKMDWAGTKETIKDFVQSALRTTCRGLGIFEIMQDVSRIVNGDDEKTRIELKAKGLRTLIGIKQIVREKIKDAGLPISIVAMVINEPPEPVNADIATAIRGKAQVLLEQDRDLAHQQRLLVVSFAENKVAVVKAAQLKQVLKEKAKALAVAGQKEALVLEAQLAALQEVAKNPGKIIMGTGDLLAALGKVVPITPSTTPPPAPKAKVP